MKKPERKGWKRICSKEFFEQIGKKATKDAVGKSTFVVGAFVGAFFDVAQMNRVLEYADVFYNKRFLLEKEVRINMLLMDENDEPPVIVDVTDL